MESTRGAAVLVARSLWTLRGSDGTSRVRMSRETGSGVGPSAPGRAAHGEINHGWSRMAQSTDFRAGPLRIETPSDGRLVEVEGGGGGESGAPARGEGQEARWGSFGVARAERGWRRAGGAWQRRERARRVATRPV
jgi:hypothetical protein